MLCDVSQREMEGLYLKRKKKKSAAKMITPSSTQRPQLFQPLRQV